MKELNSRQKAFAWPYPRHRHFQAELRKAAAAWFAERHFPTLRKLPYILAHRDKWPANIIVSEVADYIRQIQLERSAQGKGFPLHKYIHHGLSSQALLFNLIGPLIVEDDSSILQPLTNSPGKKWLAENAAAQFEYEDRVVFHEDYGQPTSIDLVLTDEAGQPRIFIESKFTETEFGGCSVFAAGDCDGRTPAHDFSLCYLHHNGRRYWELLDKYEFLAGPVGDEKVCILTHHYQFFRCLLFALEHNGMFVLLSDERSPVFNCDGPQGQRGLWPFLLSFVPEAWQASVLNMSIQDVVTAVKQSGRHPWITEFEKKYGLT
ncbi:MAG: hypothetical protein KC413_02440 [Anaerolineales bacterium]|nr:hypothetical protein [Anaerolineales bacterium]